MIIGITGLAGAGKDTVGSYLVTNFDFTRYGFADKLKELALQANPYIYEAKLQLADLVSEVGWDKAKNECYSVRQLLQGIGHGARLVFNDSFWIDQVLKIDLPDKVVITDVRYANEFDAVREAGGKIIRVLRDVELVNNHITEVGHKDIPVDYHLDNNSSRRELYQQINDLMYREFGL